MFITGKTPSNNPDCQAHLEKIFFSTAKVRVCHKGALLHLQDELQKLEKLFHKLQTDRENAKKLLQFVPFADGKIDVTKPLNEIDVISGKLPLLIQKIQFLKHLIQIGLDILNN